MLKIVAFLALTLYQAHAGGVEVLPAAPVATAVVTARSSQYFAQNHNALSAPLVAPTARIQAVAPVAPVAPIAHYFAPSSASVSQVTRYAQYVTPAVAQYVAAPYIASAPIVQAPFVSRAAPLAFAPAAPFLARPVVAPLVARSPVAVAAAQPVAPVQPAVAQQPSANPAFLAPNPDAESVEIESARIRSLPTARNQPIDQRSFQNAPSVAQPQTYSNFAQAQQNFAGYQDQLVAQNQLSAPSGSLPQNYAQPQNQQVDTRSQPSARNQAPEQQQSAAPGLLSNQQYIQGPYLG